MMYRDLYLLSPEETNSHPSTSSNMCRIVVNMFKFSDDLA